MEGSTSETPKPAASFQFNPHRKSHLRSHTYSTLLRILSHCRQHSHCSHDDPVPDHDSSGLGRVTEKEVGNELVISDTGEPEDMPIQKDPIIHESSEGMPIRKDPIVDESAEVISFQEVGSINVQVVMDELEQTMRGKENKDAVVGKSNSSPILSFDKDQNNTSSELEHLMAKKEDKGAVVGKSIINLLTSALDKNQNADHVDAWINNHEDCFDLQHVIMEEDEDGEQVKASNEQNHFLNLEDLSLSIDDYINGEDSKADENNNEKNSPFKGIALEDPGLKVQQKEMGLEKSVFPKTASSPLYVMIDGDIEEGEISGDFMGDDLSIEDDVASEMKKGEEESISENIINKEEFTCNEQKIVNDKDSESTSKIVSSVDKVDHGVEVTESNRSQMRCKSQMGRGGRTINGAKKIDGSDRMRKAETSKMKGSGAKVDFDCPANFLDDLVFHGESLAENAAENLSITSVKEGVGVTKKRKRVLSKEKRAKKKQKERNKRAEKNKELGVRRLRLLPVSKPKTVTYCRHYLKGRCQEGDQCRFSHDTIPLTKSTPCSYFARGTCMKGDDCPFDHQLSNYPCNNYVSKGFCSRGDDCLFSHKMPLKESSPAAVNVCKPVSKLPSLPSKSNSKKLDMNGTSHQNANSLSHPVGIFPQSNMEKKVAETVLKLPDQASRGINFLLFGKSPMDNSGKLKQIGSTPKMDEGVKVDNQKNRDEVQNMNEKPKRTPVAVPPRGINFLSFGKAPSNDFSVMKLAGSPSNREDGNKISPLSDSNKHKQADSSSTRDGSINVSNPLNQSATETIHKLNEMSNRRQPSVAPAGMNFLSFGKAPLDDLHSKRQSKSPSKSGNVIEIPIQKRQRASSGFQNSSAVPWGLPASPIMSDSDQLVHGHNKDTSSSAQKTLLSTLAFAAKYESALKIDRSIVTPSVSTEANKEIRNVGNSGGSQNKSMKASTILDFLFSSGGKTKL